MSKSQWSVSDHERSCAPQVWAGPAPGLGQWGGVPGAHSVPVVSRAKQHVHWAANDDAGPCSVSKQKTVCIKLDACRGCMLACRGPALDQSATTEVGMHIQRPGARARWKARSQARSGAPGRTLPALRAAESQAPEKPLASLTRSFPIARCAIHLSRVSCGARAGSSAGHCPVPAPCARGWPALGPASMRQGTAQQHTRRSTAASEGVSCSALAWSDALPERPAWCIPRCRLCVAPRPNCRMSAVRRKIVKERGAEPTELEESVAQVRARPKHGLVPVLGSRGVGPG